MNVSIAELLIIEGSAVDLGGGLYFYFLYCTSELLHCYTGELNASIAPLHIVVVTLQHEAVDTRTQRKPCFPNSLGFRVR